MDPLAAMAGGSGPLPTPSAPSTEPDAAQALAPELDVPPEQEDKMMLLDDFRHSPPEDALAAFEALLAAFGVKRG
jgi:hypothetical protein